MSQYLGYSDNTNFSIIPYRKAAVISTCPLTKLKLAASDTTVLNDTACTVGAYVSP